MTASKVNIIIGSCCLGSYFDFINAINDVYFFQKLLYSFGAGLVLHNNGDPLFEGGCDMLYPSKDVGFLLICECFPELFQVVGLV